jgi:hypothetical protein
LNYFKRKTDDDTYNRTASTFTTKVSDQVYNKFVKMLRYSN